MLNGKDRLTKKHEADCQQRTYDRRIAQGYPRNIPEERFLRLAAYESTNLTPSDFTAMQDAYEALSLTAQLHGWRDDNLQARCDNLEVANKAMRDELARLKEDEANGLIVRLPCKVGDTLYDICEFVENRASPEIQEYKAKSIEITKDKHGTLFIIDSTYFRPEDFGKTVFLTREAAEAALKEAANERT